jgi:hypothetical protein
MKEFFDPEKLLTSKGRLELAVNGTFILIGFLFLLWALHKIIQLIKGSGIGDYKKNIRERNLSYSDSEYQTMADVIFRACHGWGTDEDTIYRILGYLKNKDDWNKLVSVYGKDKDGFYLPGRLIYELDHSEQRKVNDILANIGVQI